MRFSFGVLVGVVGTFVTAHYAMKWDKEAKARANREAMQRMWSDTRKPQTGVRFPDPFVNLRSPHNGQ